MAITCGIDWAEKHHDVTLVGDDGRVIVHRRITTDAAGFTALIALLTEHAGDPTSVPVAIETDKNLVVVGLQAVGVTVYPINPRACARYRERHSQSGGKSDPGDAFVLASILRTDQHMHRALPQLSDDSKGLKALARQHQEAIWAMHQTQSRLRSVLLEFYPQALDAFPNLNHKAAHTFLAALPSPASAQKLTLARTVTLLRRSGRGNRAGLAEKIRAALTAPGIRQPAPVEDALAVTVQGLVAIIVMMQASVEALELALGKAFATLPAARIVEDIPGLGVVLGARVLAEIGDDLTRFVTASGLRSFAGTAPITRASGKSRYVKARKVRNRRLADACHWWAFNAITRSPGARAHYDRRRKAGDYHNAALRNLANKLLGRLWWCLAHDELWNENTAWPTPETTAELIAA